MCITLTDIVFVDKNNHNDMDERNYQEHVNVRVHAVLCRFLDQTLLSLKLNLTF